MSEVFVVKCLCQESEGLVESPEEQIGRLFNKANDKEKETVIQILGTEFWSDGHVHDGVVLEKLFEPIVQVLEYPIAANGIVRRMVRKELCHTVLTGLDGLEAVPESGCMLGFFYLNAIGEKQEMKKAWNLFKAGVVKEYSMKKFAEFMKNNDNVMPKEIVDRVVEIGNGIAYLYN